MFSPFHILKFFIFLVIFYIPQVWSLIRFEDSVFPELVTGGRPLAMGNAFICKTDDSNAVFYNPAGLGTVRWTHLHLTNIHLETNKGLLDAGAGGNASSVSSDIMKGFSVEGTRKLLLENRGTMTHNRVNLMPNFTARYFSFGYFYSKQNRATLGKETDALYEFSVREDQGPFAAINLSLFGGILKFGASGAYVYRKEIIDERDAQTQIRLESSSYKKGAAFIVTSGGKLTLPISMLPTFAATLHQSTNVSFHDKGGAGTPDPIRQTIDVGFSLTPQWGKNLRFHMEANYKDIHNHYPEVASFRKFQLGAEVDLKRTFFIRFGYGDGYGSGGIGLKSKRLEFDLTTYAVDTTSSKFQGVEDRRFSMTLSSGI